MPFKQKKCEHLDAVSDIKEPKAYECQECAKVDATWVHLRTCQTCGATLCCDSSPNRHAHKHAHTERHPVIVSAEPGEKWMWCYVDEQIARY